MDWTNRDHKKYWESLTGLKQAKGFLQGPSLRRTRELLKQKPVTVGDRTTHRKDTVTCKDSFSKWD
jgi:hypothetical protein